MQLKADFADRLSITRRILLRVEVSATGLDPAPAVGVFDARRRISAVRRRLKSQVIAQERELKQRQMNTIVGRILADLGCS